MIAPVKSDFPSDLESYLFGRITRAGGCWLWNGAKSATGYGVLTWKRKTYRAHRFSWAVANGRHPKGMLLHSCDVKPCVNPNHLREGSHAENMREAVDRGMHRRGEDRHNAILNEEAVKVLRFLKERGYTYKRLAEAYGLSLWTIRSAIKLNWK